MQSGYCYNVGKKEEATWSGGEAWAIESTQSMYHCSDLLSEFGIPFPRREPMRILSRRQPGHQSALPLNHSPSDLWAVIVHAGQKQSRVDFLSDAICVPIQEEVMDGAGVYLAKGDLRMVEMTGNNCPPCPSKQGMRKASWW